MTLRFEVGGHHLLPSFDERGIVLRGGDVLELLFPQAVLDEQLHGILCGEARLGCE